MYFGKTIQNPEIYKGSGSHWRNHINYHGSNDIDTLWYCLFYDQDLCMEFALTFSRLNNIVESEEWLNVIEENGLGGSVRGMKRPPLTEEHKAKISEKMKGASKGPMSEEQKKKISAKLKGKTSWNKGIPVSDERKKKQSESMLGKPGPNKGKIMTAEQKQKISESLRRRNVSEK